MAVATLAGPVLTAEHWINYILRSRRSMKKSRYSILIDAISVHSSRSVSIDNLLVNFTHIL